MPEKRFSDGAGAGSDDKVNVNEMHAAITHETDEPRDGFEPVPMVLILLAMALAMVGGIYLGIHSATFDSSVFDGDMREAAVASIEAPRVDPMLMGRRIFNNCAACHQQDGRGVPGQIPPLAESEWVRGQPRVLARILLHGMHEPVNVAGASYDGMMPAWARLSDDQIAAVLTYIRASWQNGAQPIEADLIADERSRSADRKNPWTAAELHEGLP